MLFGYYSISIHCHPAKVRPSNVPYFYTLVSIPLNLISPVVHVVIDITTLSLSLLVKHLFENTQFKQYQ